MNTLQIYHDFLVKKKVTDDGAKGKAFEVAIRKFIQPTSKREGVTHANASYGDMRLKLDGSWVKVEIKTACGELATIECDDESAITFSAILPKADYVIYCPEINDNIPMEQQGFVFTRDEFLEMIASYSGRGAILRTKPASRDAGFRISFQSFRADSRPKASAPIANHIWDCCYNQPTVADWVEDVRG